MLWTKRAPMWGQEGSPDLRLVVEEVLRLTPSGAAEVLDIGCGTGALSLPLARRGNRVLAVDLSPAMTAALQENAKEQGLGNVTTRTIPAQALQLPAESLDAVVSNYALHHLRDRDKERVVQLAVEWLRPSGRLIIGDMMFGRGATKRDRSIIASKVSALAQKGPGGWWRIAKNIVRFILRTRERPLTIDAWIGILENAGFVEIAAVEVVSEAAVVVGLRPRNGAAPALVSGSGRQAFSVGPGWSGRRGLASLERGDRRFAAMRELPATLTH